MPTKSRLVVALAGGFSLLSSIVFAEPAVAPFYLTVMKMKPEGKLGQVIKQENVETPIPGAKAWRIAYISSDLNDKKTISTGLIVAPKGKAQAGGRPIISWSHGTTGNAQNCGPS